MCTVCHIVVLDKSDIDIQNATSESIGNVEIKLKYIFQKGKFGAVMGRDDGQLGIIFLSCLC